MSEAPPISLRAWPPADVSKDLLPSLISRINQQRGSFRNITEDSLEEEIRNAQDGDPSSTDQSNTPLEDDTRDLKSRAEEVATAREEILKHVA